MFFFSVKLQGVVNEVCTCILYLKDQRRTCIKGPAALLPSVLQRSDNHARYSY